MMASFVSKRVWLWAIAPLSLVQIAATALYPKNVAKAENHEHVRQLLQTGDCIGCDLSGANLSGLNLRGANLSSADLSGATFQQTQLMYANLENADLSDAILAYSDLSGANLQNANLAGINSLFACDSDQLETNNFDSLDACVNAIAVVQVGQIDLCREEYGLPELFAVLSEYGGDCIEEVIDENLLLQARQRIAPRNFLYTLGLIGADLSGANLQDADLSGADLRYANLSSADATGADLSYAMLLDAELDSLKGADLSLAWKNRRELGDWLTAHNVEKIRDHRQTQGREYLFQLGEMQRIFFEKNGTFADDTTSLEGSLQEFEDNEFYTLGFDISEERNLVIQYALSNLDSLHSYISILLPPADPDSQLRESVVVCESDDVGVVEIDLAPNASTLADVAAFSEGSCLEGWRNQTYGSGRLVRKEP